MKLYHITYWTHNMLVLITGIVSAPIFFLSGKKIEFNFLSKEYIKKQEEMENYKNKIPALKKAINRHTTTKTYIDTAISLAYCYKQIGETDEAGKIVKVLGRRITKKMEIEDFNHFQLEKWNNLKTL